MSCKLMVRNMLGVALLAIMPAISRGAEDGAGLYKKKCAGCHGSSGEGKPAMKAPALKGTTQSVSGLAQHITKGVVGSKAPHNKGIAGMNDAQATAIAEFIKTLK
jgi:mono/diheme cytochrome c family protein